ncbi:MAG TPA: neutral/alkaline non-lysosomal ceramidase N-terminal domain-containing protein, partial [Chloroflexota bacterium]|nr:neutral/alkaline non-lysosomal ceramidase N-terminal domain-containing protein [Chloroflexota bacterium]
MIERSNGIRVGAARAVITPPVGVSLAGSYSDRRAVDLHDELFARAFVIGDGSGEARGQVAIVSCDLIGVRASTVAGARRLIEAACGIPGDNVLISATHNHSGPLTRELVASGLAGEPDEPYLAHLERQIATAVKVAARRAAPARLHLAVGHEHGIAFNRR